ncbi:hypothetical protein X751_05670 [Mesorhizobium sp. LNJC395A00]|nr:hypothetical protein X751_05670 [Mesorhizobium sp. LNJC395A00]
MNATAFCLGVIGFTNPPIGMALAFIVASNRSWRSG